MFSSVEPEADVTNNFPKFLHYIFKKFSKFLQREIQRGFFLQRELQRKFFTKGNTNGDFLQREIQRRNFYTWEY